jgi:hypothetical protein
MCRCANVAATLLAPIKHPCPRVPPDVHSHVALSVTLLPTSARRGILVSRKGGIAGIRYAERIRHRWRGAGVGLLNVVGNVASIVGLAVTIWVLFRVRNIEKAFLKQALLPSTMRVLRRYIGNLEQAIQTRNRESTSQALERCRSLLMASFDYLEGDRRQSCGQTAEVIEHVRAVSVDLEFWIECHKALSRLHGVHEDFKTLVKELEWRTKDAN